MPPIHTTEFNPPLRVYPTAAKKLKRGGRPRTKPTHPPNLVLLPKGWDQTTVNAVAQHLRDEQNRIRALQAFFSEAYDMWRESGERRVS